MGNSVELLFAALLIHHLAFVILGIAAVYQYSDRVAVNPAGLGNFGLGGAGNFVVVGFFGFLALIACRGRGVPVLISRQLVVDRDLSGIVGSRRRFLAGLA